MFIPICQKFKNRLVNVFYLIAGDHVPGAAGDEEKTRSGDSVVRGGGKSHFGYADTFNSALGGEFFFLICKMISELTKKIKFQSFAIIGGLIAAWFYLALWIESCGRLVSENNVNFFYEKDGVAHVRINR